MADAYTGVTRALVADEPVCECGHIHSVHDTYGDGPPDAFGEPTMTLECSRCACKGMTVDDGHAIGRNSTNQ